METLLQKRVRERMDALGLSALQTAKNAGLGDSFVRDILRGKTRSPSSENLQKLAKALETTPDFLSNTHATDELGRLPQEISGLEVVGVIRAGYWLDMTINDDCSDHEILPVAKDRRFPHARQYALEVVGDSMNLEYPEGCYVTCVDYAESGLGMKPGRIVHVERHNGSLVEVTLKAVEMVDGKIVLSPRSSNPKHLPIALDGDEGTEIVIKGVVTGSYRRTEI